MVALVQPAQLPPQSKTEGVAFFKLVNTSKSIIEIEVSDPSGKKFSQILIVGPGKSQFLAVKEGEYLCGLRGGEKKSTLIGSGQIVQVDLPWAVQAAEVPKKEEPKKPEPPKKEEPKEPEPEIVKEPVKEPEPPKGPPDKIKPTQAYIELKGVPEGAVIHVDDMKMSGKKMWFSTPDALQPGVTYFYIIRVQVEREGRIYVDSRRAVIQGGMKTTITFNLPP